jgi:hypothetical protein
MRRNTVDRRSTQNRDFCTATAPVVFAAAAAPSRRSEIARTGNNIALVTLRDYKECQPSLL